MLYERSDSLLFSDSALKQLIWESLTERLCQYLEKLLKHCVSPEVLLIEGLVQDAL